jgi:hypothetical protein
MRLTKERIQSIVSTTIGRLRTQGLIEITGSTENLTRLLDHAITEELAVEDRLNAEIREILKKFESDFEKGRADYQKMFTMVKQKLIRERGLIL